MSVYKLVIAVLSLFSIALLSASVFMPEDSEVARLIGYYDFGLCLVFLYDFYIQFSKAESKARYFFTYGWLDLLSSIPMIGAFRFARFFRVFRVFRVIKSLNLLWIFLRSHRRSSLYGIVVLLISLSVIVCSVAVLYVEKDTGNIRTADEALWWTFVSITTVGYGDFYPTTGLGRILSVVLIFNGLVAFGTVLTYMNEKLASINDAGPDTGKEL
ncbi:MAG: potassium channel protein [Cryomorphaceae bacterium]|nr:MAG: potassium channel protein [Cryomorphaceae bacterium]